MRTKIILLVGILFGAFMVSSDSYAGMRSTHFCLYSSIISGGWASMISANYQKEATLGQPTPLMNPSSPPCSNHYDIYTGFWCALGPSELSEPAKSLPWLLLLLD